jgi:hypothetical protein
VVVTVIAEAAIVTPACSDAGRPLEADRHNPAGMGQAHAGRGTLSSF